MMEEATAGASGSEISMEASGGMHARVIAERQLGGMAFQNTAPMVKCHSAAVSPSRRSSFQP